MGVEEKIREIEDEIRKTQKNKATEYHIGLLKAKLAKLRRILIAPKGSGGGGGFDIRKSGDATVAIIGFPSVGKSTLLMKITNAESRVAPFAFTTLKCIPGIMQYKGAKIQVLDLPGIIEGAKDGKGRGREVIAVARSSDLILIIVDAASPTQHKKIVNELEGFGIRLDGTPPNVVVKKTLRGGVNMESTVKLTKITEREVMATLNEYGYYSADVVFREDINIDGFIDVVEKNRAYIPSVVVLNKIDLLQNHDHLKNLDFDYLPISAEKSMNTENLKEIIYNKLNLIRIFTRRKGEKTDLEEPLIVKQGTTVRILCDILHRDLRKEFKYALVWGKSVKHPGQRVGLNHVVLEGDLIQIVKRFGLKS